MIMKMIITNTINFIDLFQYNGTSSIIFSNNSISSINSATHSTGSISMCIVEEGFPCFIKWDAITEWQGLAIIKKGLLELCSSDSRSDKNSNNDIIS